MPTPQPFVEGLVVRRSAARSLIVLLATVVSLPSSVAADGPRVDFDRDVRPILSNVCFKCHGPDRQQRKGELRLDLKDDVFADRGGRAAVVPGKLDASELYRRITSRDKDERMPPATERLQLTPAQIDTMKRWIAQGADWSQHWSFVKPQRPDVATVERSEWSRNAIDRFVQAKLEAAGMEPSPQAGRETLIRRVTLDLTGLPPTLEEIDDFLADKSPPAYERVVDRLLASPRYGEHISWSWLEAARYSDTNGYQQDRTRTMWPWRDWVVRAFNADMPFDRFTLWQIAGDLLPNATIEQKLATGFHRNHMLNGEGGRIAEESRVEYVVDRVETTGTVWLGLTVGCCRCHDHKYDPVSQNEFYRLFAYFNSIDEKGSVDRGGNANPVMKLPTPQQSAEIARRERRLAELNQSLKMAGDEKRRKQLKSEIDKAKKSLDGLRKSVVEVMVMRDRANPRETYRLIRGAWDRPDKKTRLFPGVPAVLHPLGKQAPTNRLALAQWLIDENNPLTARVVVNRAWQHFFGGGLVRTPEDFGSQGQRPTHPRLLDWLAVEFGGGSRVEGRGSSGGGEVEDRGSKIEDRRKETKDKRQRTKDKEPSNPQSEIRNPKSFKRLHRLIVTSATYRQSSRVTPESLKRDPANLLLGRASRFRLTAAALRDQALATSRLLAERIGGPPVKPYQPSGVWSDFSLGKIKYQHDKGESLYRRSVYTFWRRSVGPTMFFDSSSRQVCTVNQSRTNTPLHALTLMNDIGYVEASRKLAERVLREAGPAERDRLVHAFRLATSRRPAPAELQAMQTTLSALLDKYRAAPGAASQLLTVGESPADKSLDQSTLAAWAGLMSMVLNLDEVLSRE